MSHNEYKPKTQGIFALFADVEKYKGVLVAISSADRNRFAQSFTKAFWWGRLGSNQ